MNYEKYLIELFDKPLKLMRKLHLTEDELLKLEYFGITPDGFDLNALVKLMIQRYKKHENTSFEFKDKLLLVDCQYENNEFKSDMIKFMSNFPTYEIKFVNHGY